MGIEKPGQLMEESLLKEDPVVLARDVREQGDAVRGAAIFYQPALTCVKCHVGDEPSAPTLGPDLAAASARRPRR